MNQTTSHRVGVQQRSADHKYRLMVLAFTFRLRNTARRGYLGIMRRATIGRGPSRRLRPETYERCPMIADQLDAEKIPAEILKAPDPAIAFTFRLRNTARRGYVGIMRRAQVKLYSVINSLRGRLKTAAFERRGRISIARGVTITTNRHAHIDLGDRVQFGEYCGIAVFGSHDRPAKLTIGDRTSFQPKVRINCVDNIQIGQDCIFSWEVDILDTDFHSIINSDGNIQPNHAPIQIQDRVWVGAGVKILKGVTIGNDAVVAAGAIVTRSVPSRTLVAGCPAKVVKQIDGWTH
jgi:acetyltransferase-like isoleucine patch superfamily enzyme